MFATQLRMEIKKKSDIWSFNQILGSGQIKKIPKLIHFYLSLRLCLFTHTRARAHARTHTLFYSFFSMVKTRMLTASPLPATNYAVSFLRNMLNDLLNRVTAAFEIWRVWWPGKHTEIISVQLVQCGRVHCFAEWCHLLLCWMDEYGL